MTLKRLITTILLVTVITLQALAQGAIGSIKIHPKFGNEVTKVIDTGQMVYYLSDNTLFSYDKDNDESDSYSRNNRLNGSSIDNIYYNYDKDYLVVAYDNTNIDVLTADGATINMPEIYNAELQTSPVINDITFADQRILVATNFGYVVFNDERFEVEFSRNFGTNVNSIAATDNYLWVNADTLYYSPLSNPARTLSGMTATSLHENARLLPTTGDAILFVGGWLYRPEITSEGRYRLSVCSHDSHFSTQQRDDGFLFFTRSRSTMKYIDMEGNEIAHYTVPEEMRQSVMASREEQGQLWELSSQGLRHVLLDDAGGITVLSDFYRPNASSVTYPHCLAYNDATGDLIVCNSGATSVTLNTYRVQSQINKLNNGWWSDAMPGNVTLTNDRSGGLLRDIYQPVFSPFDPDTYFIGSRYEGVYQIKGDEVVVKYDDSNSLIDRYTINETSMFIPSLAFDASNNLWILQSPTNGSHLLVLPANKVQSGASVTAADWVSVDVPALSGISFLSRLVITRRNDVKIVADGSYEGTLNFLYDNGNPSSSAIQIASYASGELLDQDGTGYSWRYINSVVEDANGTVWMGTNNGIITFNPANAFSAGFYGTRPRIPRNDGTNYADNLLDGTTVYSIAVDGANRKWIGTESGGLYLVNADGSEVLQHFTTDNSQLPSNMIYSVCCSTRSNSVFVGTADGVVEVYSDASQPQSDYNSVYAYPNPVRPEYTGDIAIAGLMENSLVKITDSTGNVVRSLQSVGGTAIWDGCNASGRRVKTGVYFVLVSQSDGTSSSGKVATKILFVN